MRPLGLIAFALLAAIAAWFAVANRNAVVFSLDATRPGAPGSSLDVPLFAVLLVGVLAGLIVGALYMVAGQARIRRQLREEQARNARLQRLLSEETLRSLPKP